MARTTRSGTAPLPGGGSVCRPPDRGTASGAGAAPRSGRADSDQHCSPTLAGLLVLTKTLPMDGRPVFWEISGSPGSAEVPVGPTVAFEMSESGEPVWGETAAAASAG